MKQIDEKPIYEVVWRDGYVATIDGYAITKPYLYISECKFWADWLIKRIQEENRRYEEKIDSLGFNDKKYSGTLELIDKSAITHHKLNKEVAMDSTILKAMSGRSTVFENNENK